MVSRIFVLILTIAICFAVWPLSKGEISPPLTEAEVRRLFGPVGLRLYEVLQKFSRPDGYLVYVVEAAGRGCIQSDLLATSKFKGNM